MFIGIFKEIIGSLEPKTLSTTLCVLEKELLRI
jgi:hypothetical protein